MRALLLTMALIPLAASMACARDPLTAPTSTTTLLPLTASGRLVAITAMVLEARSERPIARAVVFVDAAHAGSTDEEGAFTTQAEPGREFTMSTTADGYHPSVTVAGTAQTAERWTFYLEPANAR